MVETLSGGQATIRALERIWWVVRGSNPRHLRCKRSALPTELTTLTDALIARLCGTEQGRISCDGKVLGLSGNLQAQHGHILSDLAGSQKADWWVMRDLNPRHLRCERSALPLS